MGLSPARWFLDRCVDIEIYMCFYRKTHVHTCVSLQDNERAHILRIKIISINLRAPILEIKIISINLSFKNIKTKEQFSISSGDR